MYPLAKRLLPKSCLRFLYRAVDRLKGRSELPPEMKAIAYLAHTGKCSVDVGAHKGAFIGQLLRYSQSVVAFEPIPDRHAALMRKYSSPFVTIINKALSDRDGTAEFRIPYSPTGEKVFTGLATLEATNQLSGLPFNVIEIQLGRLDSCGVKHVGLIKIDVEGHECAVLEGGKKFFESELPNVIIETENRHRAGAPDRVIAFFGQLGYDGYMILGRKVLPVSNFDAAVHQNVSQTDFGKPLKHQNYAYNFLFVSPRYKQQTKLPAVL